MATAFQPSAFQNNAFQIDGGVVVPPHHGPRLGSATVTRPAGDRHRRHLVSAAFAVQIAWHAELESNDDDLAMTLLL